jgi:hypothetical protein
MVCDGGMMRYKVRSQLSDGSMKAKLTALRDRLAKAQRELILAATETGTVPSDNALRKIADLEVTISAVEHMLETAQ